MLKLENLMGPQTILFLRYDNITPYRNKDIILEGQNIRHNIKIGNALILRCFLDQIRGKMPFEVRFLFLFSNKKYKYQKMHFQESILAFFLRVSTSFYTFRNKNSILPLVNFTIHQEI